MKKIFILLFAGMFLISSGVFPQKREGDKLSNPLGEPDIAYLNLNNISTIFLNNGTSDFDPNIIPFGGSGFKYPKETGKTAVFRSGLLWGAKIAGDPQVRVGGSAYRTGLQGGKILSPGVAEDPNDPHVRIYRVRPDVYPGGPPVDLSWEALDEVKTEPEVRAQYELDWTEWRAQDGAPYLDGNNNGQYDPDPTSYDVPGIEGAIQTIWFVANDLDPGLTYSLYGTAPIGIEYQATIWEYKDSLGFDNLFYRKYKLINKSYDTFDSMYVSMWSDPDIGYAGDDFVGCDTLLSLGYAYNAVDVDSGYLPLPPPAVGFDLIRGPLVPGNPGEDKNRNGVDDISDFVLTEGNQQVNGFINLPMSAFYYFSNNDTLYTDPLVGDPEGATQFYNFFQGKIGTTGEYFINPITGLPTTYVLSGNPVTGEGWIDGILQGPGDRRFGLSTSPFQMEPSDTQIVVIAEIAAGAIDGVTRKMAIDTLKYYSELAQAFYDEIFPGPVSVENGVKHPRKYQLFQNFPNPFNPITKINYQIPELSFVTLKVYDVLGSEIVTLVNEEKPIGSYEVKFDATNLPSGIYFYRIQAGSFVETKKMLLLK